MRQKTSRRLIRRSKKLQREYSKKLCRICRFFGIDPFTPKRLTKEQYLEVLRKLGVPEDAIKVGLHLSGCRYRYKVYVPYDIVGIWPEEGEDET